MNIMEAATAEVNVVENRRELIRSNYRNVKRQHMLLVQRAVEVYNRSNEEQKRNILLFLGGLLEAIINYETNSYVNMGILQIPILNHEANVAPPNCHAANLQIAVHNLNDALTAVVNCVNIFAYTQSLMVNEVRVFLGPTADVQIAINANYTTNVSLIVTTVYRYLFHPAVNEKAPLQPPMALTYPCRGIFRVNN